MSAQIGATVATVGSVVRGILGRRFGTFAGVALAAMTLGGCAVPLAPLVGAAFKGQPVTSLWSMQVGTRSDRA